MSPMEDRRKDLADSDTIHDFLSEHHILKVIACYSVLKSSRLHFTLNIIFIGCTFILYVYILTTIICTLSIPNTKPGFKVQAYQILGVISVVIVVPPLALYYSRNYAAAVQWLKTGFNKYIDEEPDSEHEKFKRQRVRQTRLWSLIFGGLCYMVAVAHILRPAFKYMLIPEDDSSNGLINSYLPLPLVVPFDTRTATGFALAFLLDVAYLFLLYTLLTCFTETYFSSTLQLLAQMEIFNHSIRRIKNRATLKLNSEMKRLPRRFGTSVESEKREEFQRCLCLCLKTSIQHHQAILGYYQEVKDYLGAMNSYCIFVFAFIFASSVVTLINNPLGNMALIVHLVMEVTGYFQLFMVGQVISDESKNAINSLYSTPWTNANKSYRTMLNIMLTTAKKPIILRAPFFNADWTLETFGAMLSGAYKLVNLMLNTV